MVKQLFCTQLDVGSIPRLRLHLLAGLLVLVLSACTYGHIQPTGELTFMRLWTDTYIETPDFIYSSDAEASSDNKVLTDLISKIP